ncbi:dipeptide/oligopeptide/nickel ABC transporter permease/ATP-binding protein [Arthrobacter sp. B2a2-09]|uniref:dipeptide/oligopeptide/nickel ABC transporter permease/ATP-binding protein n=1 Tax=Arthrobacter sp. B2a2-09 TaxID=2952822 RepID=UPI0022CD468B|nr:dipeptide/oligopeptide/nickel ABC transporter permease/ATP-binding protein [Arthrobacter sp. B2a2-09]MCZ9882830.1 dipeptide/oligopeptide/nickel ABC transporter permease/ATP-binding protein [Arthrobacter sp. B2a2-09]
MTTPSIGQTTDVGAANAPKRIGAFRRIISTPLGLFSVIILLSIVMLGILEPVLRGHDPNTAELSAINAPPGTPGYFLGADQNGRDIWSRVLASINVSVISALIGSGVAVAIGSIFGLISGYIGKRLDGVLAWLFSLLMTFPAMILIMVLQPITGGTYQTMMALFGIFISPGIFWLVRNLVIGVKNELYVDAAKVSGLSNRRILSRHVLYVVRGPIIISAAFMATAAIGIQAGLAFLGFGSGQDANFGTMTGDAFLNIYRAPLQLLWPSLFLALMNAALVLLGNAYRDALAGPQAVAPRQKKKQSAAKLEVTKPLEAHPQSAEVSASARAELLSVRNLRVSYPNLDGTRKEVVKGTSLFIRPGEIVGLVGESGSGKSQTAFSILGLLPKQAEVSADVMNLAGDSLLQQDGKLLRRMRGSVISYIPQEPMSNLDPSFTIGSQLVEGLRASMSKKEAKETALALLARVGITDPERTFKSYPHQISGGMAQRVLIAGAVAPRPKLLIADEPTTALDVTVQAEILDLLRDLQGELGMGVLLVTHNFGVVADLCDRVLVMRDGEIVEGGHVRTIFRNPSHPYTQELISSILDEATVRTDPELVGVKEHK